MEFAKLSSSVVVGIIKSTFLVVFFCILRNSSCYIDPLNALSFFRTVGKLKQLKRTGWVNHGIPLPESVADHMYRMSMITFLVQDPAVDKDKLMKICMVHDLAEAIVGDITPHDGVSKEEKRRLEEAAMKKILSEVGDERISNEIMLLWLAYEEGDSLEADLARQLDKLEMIIQANEYECLHPEQRLDSFFQSTADSFKHPQILEWANALRKERDTRQQN